MVVGQRRVLKTTIDVDLWIKRLGHSSEFKLIYIDILGGFSSKLKNKVSDSCVKAIHTRHPFLKSSIKTDDRFELLHHDV